MSPEQCRAARAWLDWSQRFLAVKARVSVSTIRNFETGRRVPHGNNLRAIRHVLEEAGIHFGDGKSIARVIPKPGKRKSR